jgi:hypothetical protein
MAEKSKYKPEYCALLISHSEDGGDFRSFAGVVRVNRDTLYRWLKHHPEFAEAREEAEEILYKWWVDTGKKALYDTTIKNEDGSLVSHRINPTMYIWMTKNILGWRDKQEIAATVTNGNDARIEDQKKEIESLTQQLMNVRQLRQIK